jgi:leucyl-tRNA synthetase
VPAHDQRDLIAAASTCPWLVVEVEAHASCRPTRVVRHATVGTACCQPGPLDGLRKAEAIERIIRILQAKGLGRAAVNYRPRTG